MRQQGAAVDLHLLQALSQISVGGLQLHHPVQSYSELQNQKRIGMKFSREPKLLELSNTSPLSATSSFPPSAHPPSARRSPLLTCSVSPDPPVGSPDHRKGSGSTCIGCDPVWSLHASGNMQFDTFLLIVCKKMYISRNCDI